MTSTAVIGSYTAATGIDGAAHYLLIQPGSSSTAYNKINRNVFLGVSGQPADISTSQNITNKTLDNSNILTIRDDRFTLQDNSDTTKQAQFQLSGITTSTTRTYTLPNASSTLADISTIQTFTNKTLTSPTITGGSIDNATITVDTITGHTTSNAGSIYGVSITGGKIGSSGLAAQSVTPTILNTGATSMTTISQASTTSTSFTPTLSDSVTTSVTVTIGSNGLALVIITCDTYNNTTGDYCFVSFVASGANTITANSNNALINKNITNGQELAMSWCKVFTGLTAGSTTFTLNYMVNASTGEFQNRSISVVPL